MLIIQLVIVQAIVFAILVFFLKKLIFTDTNSALHRLSDARSLTEKKQDELEKKTKGCEEECRQKIEAAKKEAETIIKETRAKAEEDSKALISQARAEAEEIIKKASSVKDKMRQSILKDMNVKAVDFAKDLLDKTLEGDISERYNEHLVESFIKELSNIDTKHISSEINTIEVISRYKLASSTRDRIKDIFRDKLKREVEIVEKIDNAVLGGVILKFGTLILDGSVASKIKEASEEIKKGAEG